MITPAAAMVWTLAVYFGWQLFADGPRAFYVMAGLSVVGIFALAAMHGGRRWWPASAFGALMGALQAGCGMVVDGVSEGFICDNGTGLPVAGLTLSAAVGVVVWYWQESRRHE